MNYLDQQLRNMFPHYVKAEHGHDKSRKISDTWLGAETDRILRNSSDSAAEIYLISWELPNIDQIHVIFIERRYLFLKKVHVSGILYSSPE